MKHNIHPCLWFDGQAKEAADFYCSIFPNSKIISTSPMVTNFEIDGAQFLALNGGPQFKFNESISFMIGCDTQEEIDYFWEKLSYVPEAEQCGWLKDKFGVSWQVIPNILSDLMEDPEKADRVVAAFMKMKKFDIEALKNA